eukprot:g3191.t1
MEGAQKCTDCIKGKYNEQKGGKTSLDYFLFAGDHFISDGHAKRMLDTRLGAAFTLSIPFILGMISVQIFGANNLLISDTLAPHKTLSPPLNYSDPSLFNTIKINVVAFTLAKKIDCEEALALHALLADSMKCAKQDTKQEKHVDGRRSLNNTFGTVCKMRIVCNVGGTLAGNTQLIFSVQDAFQIFRNTGCANNAEFRINALQIPRHYRDIFVGRCRFEHAISLWLATRPFDNKAGRIKHRKGIVRSASVVTVEQLQQEIALLKEDFEQKQKDFNRKIRELMAAMEEHQVESTQGHWTREYDEPGNGKPRAKAKTRYFHKYETEDGEAYFVPESDDEQSFWYLPDGGEVLSMGVMPTGK